MKRAILLLAACALFLGALAAPTQARVTDDACKIVIQGVPYQGEWAMIGETPYVGIESFGKALGYPRGHCVKSWCLNPPAPPATECTATPFELAVQAKGKALRTVRFGGNTMVDLRQALEVLEIPFNRRYYDQAFMVGNPYFGETMAGAWYRWRSLHYNHNAMGTGHILNDRPETIEADR